MDKIKNVDETKKSNKLIKKINGKKIKIFIKKKKL